MRQLLQVTLCILTSLYIIDADEKNKSLVVLEYDTHPKDIVVIPKKFEYNHEYIYKIIEPILIKRGVL